MNIPRKRSGSNSKKTKEKYEVLFKNEESEEITESLLAEIINSNISLDNFEIEVMKIVNIDQSVVVRRNLNLLIKEGIKSLDSGGCQKYFSETPTRYQNNVFIFRQLEKDCKQLENSRHSVLLHDEEVQWIFAGCAA